MGDDGHEEDEEKKKLRSFCRSLPKVELHAHLGGCARQSSLRKRLEKIKTSAEEVEDLMTRSRIHDGIDLKRTPTEQMEMFDIVRMAFPSADDKKQIAIEYIEDCARENIVYLELRSSGADQEKFDSIFSAFEEAAANHHHKQLPPVITRMVSSVQRSWTFAQAEQSIRLAVRNKDRGVVGVDLCGDPTSGDFRPFASLFQYAKREGLKFTCHFAESRGESDLEAILDVQPDRLGHCCYLHESDPDTIQRRVYQGYDSNSSTGKGIPIEACLASNINVMRLTGGIQTHPVVSWLERKHPVIPCTDNVGILGSDLSDHYAMIAPWISSSSSLSSSSFEEEMLNFAESCVDHIFAGDDVKEQLKAIYKDTRRKQQQQQQQQL
eukprot:TRINITY_DN9562_c0_g1_i1.p1 TRINITY_DN9562_c0_g1~~TRINITY_DN9562_c0_g1_i1.p1  ORF type:complete len:380 (+),score=97.30 TRINITY_DN9562_c0_g1_i1:548-1687(+)